jgi:hypothetical protein
MDQACPRRPVSARFRTANAAEQTPAKTSPNSRTGTPPAASATPRSTARVGPIACSDDRATPRRTRVTDGLQAHWADHVFARRDPRHSPHTRPVPGVRHGAPAARQRGRSTRRQPQYCGQLAQCSTAPTNVPTRSAPPPRDRHDAPPSGAPFVDTDRCRDTASRPWTGVRDTAATTMWRFSGRLWPSSHSPPRGFSIECRVHPAALSNRTARRPNATTRPITTAAHLGGVAGGAGTRPSTSR